jgi:hypothetical protein
MLPRRKFLAMLPGFRFLFGAIVMCMSVLVFGLGATSLMRAAHEDFASNPTWRAPPEPRFAQQDEANRTVLAVLSVQPSVTEPAGTPKATDAAISAATADPATESLSPEPETTAALTPPEASPPGSARPATGAPVPVEASAQGDQLPSRAEAPADAPARELTVAAAEPTPSPSPTSEQATAPATPVSIQAATRIATLGGPAVITEETAAAKASASNATLDQSELNKRLRAERAKERRRLAARRAKLAQQTAAAQFELANPFIPHPLVAPQASAH